VPIAVSQESIVTNALEALGRGTDQESPDGRAMRVTAHVIEHLLLSGKRTLGIDHPFEPLGSGDLLGESSGCAKWLQGAEELQLAGIEGGLQGLQKEVAEQAGQNPNQQEEARRAGGPSLAIGGQFAAWHDTAQMRMKTSSRTIP
jgi:hypothetical protein